MNDRSASVSSEPAGPRSRRWLFVFSLGCAWAATLVMAMVVVLRLAWHDGALLLVWVNAFTVYFYLPAYACLAWAVWRRRRWLAAVNLLIIAFHLSWAGPELLPVGRSPAATSPARAASPTLRIFYANVLSSNTEYDALLEEIADADPDVICLNEFTDSWEHAFAQSPVMKPYLRAGGLPRNRFGSMGIYSRLPVSGFQTLWAGGRLSCAFDVLLGKDELRLFCLHGPRPLEYTHSDYYRFWTAIQSLVAGQSEPLIVIGDFNATPFSRAYQQLTAGRLRSAHHDVGRGYATTWPNGRYPIPPIRIDHALLSPQIECLGIVEGRGLGSDHRPLVLDVRLRPAD